MPFIFLLGPAIWPGPVTGRCTSGQPSHKVAFHISGPITSANVNIAKVSPMAKLKVKVCEVCSTFLVEGARRSHGGVWTWRYEELGGPLMDSFPHADVY